MLRMHAKCYHHHCSHISDFDFNGRSIKNPHRTMHENRPNLCQTIIYTASRTSQLSLHCRASQEKMSTPSTNSLLCPSHDIVVVASPCDVLALTSRPGTWRMVNDEGNTRPFSSCPHHGRHTSRNVSLAPLVNYLSTMPPCTSNTKEAQEGRRSLARRPKREMMLKTSSLLDLGFHPKSSIRDLRVCRSP